MKRRLTLVVLLLTMLVAFASLAIAQDQAAGWVKIKLGADEQAPDSPIYHAGKDIVSAIWFRDLDHGLIGTMEGEGSDGGVIYKAAGAKLTGVVFRGYKNAVDDSQNVQFRDFVPTPDGLVVLLNRADTFVHCDSHFKFTRESPGGEFGVETQLWLGPVAGGKWMYITGTGTVRVAGESPGRGVDWKTIWFPQGAPPVPDPVPDGMCPEAAISNTPGSLPFRYAYVSPDGKTIAYPLHSKPAVCVCTDGGKTWLEQDLPNPPASVGEAGPYGIYFTDKQHGWTFYANDLKDGSAYVYYTTDGGKTWTAGQLPDGITAADSKANFRSIFFAPDNKYGWLVGYKGNSTKPMVLRTSDGGATWDDKSGGKSSIAAVCDPPMKLFSGFALDKDHIWVGGNYGGLFYCDNASE